MAIGTAEKSSQEQYIKNMYTNDNSITEAILSILFSQEKILFSFRISFQGCKILKTVTRLTLPNVSNDMVKFDNYHWQKLKF